MGQINKFHALPSYLFKIHFNIVIASTYRIVNRSRSYRFSQQILTRINHIVHATYAVHLKWDCDDENTAVYHYHHVIIKIVTVFFPGYTWSLFLCTQFWKLKVHNSLLFQSPELSLIHFKRWQSLPCDCSGYPRRREICLLFPSNFVPYGPWWLSEKLS